MTSGSQGGRPGSDGPRFSPVDVALLAALGLLWGAAYVFIRQGIVLGASPLLFASVRYALSAGVFAAIALVLREHWPNRRALYTSALIGGILFIGLYGGFLYWGEQYTTGGYASILSTTAPILTVVVAYFLLPAERLGRGALIGLAVGFGGVVVLAVPDLEGGPGGGWGVLFVIAAFVSAAFGTVWLRRLGVGRQGLWQISSQFAVGGLLLAVAALALPYPESLPLTTGVWAALGALVVFSSVLGYFIYFTLHHRVGPVRANVVTYLIPLAGIGIGSGFFGEALSGWEIAGFLIAIVGVTLIILDTGRARRAATPPPARPSSE